MIWICSLPPHGGSGLKYDIVRVEVLYPGSPSTRREWIEMAHTALHKRPFSGLPPHGGSGLKSGSHPLPCRATLSPSTRREWIEMIP